MSASLRDCLSDITGDEDYDLRNAASRSDDNEPFVHQGAPLPTADFASPPRSPQHSTHPAVDATPTFLSPFSSKAWKQPGREGGIDSSRSDLQLSLHATRPVSIVVYVTNPSKYGDGTQGKQQPQQKDRIPCVFPPAVAFQGKLRLRGDDESEAATAADPSDPSNPINLVNHPNNPPSPTTATLQAAKQTRDLVIINPTAFGQHLPNQINLDILHAVTKVAISSEDWVRLYSFHQVLWPRGKWDGYQRLGTAIAHDVTAVASIAQRLLLGMGRERSAQLWGGVVQSTVAQAFAKTAVEKPADILETYGLLGWIVRQIGERMPATGQLTLAVLEVVPGAHKEELQDLLRTKSTGPPDVALHSTSTTTRAGGTILQGLTQVPIDPHNLKSLGHLVRRAWMAAHHPRRTDGRGHLIVTVRVHQDAANTTCKSASATCPSVVLCDLAPVSHGPTSSARRDGTVRQSLSILGGVLRGTLLKAAGNQVALPYRESLLTKVLQTVFDRSDCRTVLLSGISPLTQDYDRSMADLRYLSRILERPGEAPKSPFDTLSKTTGTSPTSQMSHFTAGSDPHQEHQVWMEQFDPKYHSDLLRNMTSDPRQRFNRAGLRPARRKVALASSGQDVEAYIPPSYMNIDPGAVALVYDEQRRETPRGSPRVNTSTTLDSLERGFEDDMEPSPVHTLRGENSMDAISQLLNKVGTADEKDDEGEEEIFLPTQEFSPVQEDFPEDTGPSLQAAENALMEEMDALSLELRRKGQNRTMSPTDSDMDDLSFELFHRKEPERPVEILDVLEESPVKAASPVATTKDPRTLHVTDLSQSNFRRDTNSLEGSSAVPEQALGADMGQLEDGRRWRSVEENSNREHSDEEQRRDRFQDISPFDRPIPHADHVDLSLYRMTPRAGSALPSDIMVHTATVASTLDSRGFHDLMDEASADTLQSKEKPAVVDAYRADDREFEIAQGRPQSTNAEERNREPSPAVHGDGSATETEIEQIDSLLHKLRRSTKSSSRSISNDLSLIEHNQRSVVRRLVEERDNARKDLAHRTQTQQEDSERSQRELLELRTSLETVHSQRVELEQIAEDAVTGREDLEKQTTELERALKKKEQESVGRNEYHLLQEECKNLKLLLRENDTQLKRFKTNVSERTTSISKLQIDLQSLDEEKGELVSHLEKERTMVDKLGEQNKHIRAELDSTRSQIIILENERNLLQSQMESTKRSLELSLDRKDGFAKNLSGEVEELQNELHLAKTQLLEKGALILRLQHVELTGTQDIEALRQTTASLEEAMEQVRTSKEALSRELSARLLDIKDLSQALREVTAERDSAEGNLAEKERQLQDGKAKVQQIKSDTISFRDEAGRSLENVVARHEESSTIIKEQTSEIDSLSRENEGLRREVELLQREKETAQMTAEDFKFRLDHLVDTRTTAVSHQEGLELARLQESNYSLESKVEDLLREMKEQKRHSKAEHMERLRSEAEAERRASFRMESGRTEGIRDSRNMSERFGYHRSGEQIRLHSQTTATAYAHDDEYRRLEEVTVSLAQALHSQSRIDEEDVAHLLRQFHAAEEAVVSHNRYFRTRIEGQLRSK